MKVLDQITGLKVSAGDPTVHIGLFVATFLMPWNQSCGDSIMGQAVKLFCLSHGLNALRIPVKYFCEQLGVVKPNMRFKVEFVERTYRIICSAVQIWALLTAQDYYFFTKSECTYEQIGLTRGWLFLEIICFWASFVASGLFILVSNLLLDQTGLKFAEKKLQQVDFLLRYFSLNGLF